MSLHFAYSFPAMCGLQAGREYFVVMCPLKVLPKLFIFNESELSPELRSNRTLNKNRLPEMCDYILNNRKEYVFSSLTASIDGSMNLLLLQINKFLPSVHYKLLWIVNCSLMTGSIVRQLLKKQLPLIQLLVMRLFLLYFLLMKASSVVNKFFRI